MQDLLPAHEAHTGWREIEALRFPGGRDDHLFGEVGFRKHLDFDGGCVRFEAIDKDGLKTDHRKHHMVSRFGKAGDTEGAILITRRAVGDGVLKGNIDIRQAFS